MDPLTVATSVFALTGAAHTATKVSRQMYRVARKAGEFEIDVQLFAAQVEIFGSMISIASSTMEDHLEKYKKSEVLERLGPNALDLLKSQSEYVLRYIRGVKRKVPTQRSGFKLFIERWKWLSNAAEREEKCLWMERIKSNFNFIVTQVYYEALHHKVRCPNISRQRVIELKRQIKAQKRLIKTQMQTITVLKIRHITKYSEQLSTHSENHILQSTNIDEILLAIGDDMIIDEVTPDSSHFSSTSDYINDAASNIEDNYVNDDGDNFSDGYGNALELVTPQLQPPHHLKASSILQAPFSPHLFPRPLRIVHKSPSVSSESLELPPQTFPPASPFDDEEYHYETVRSSSSILVLDHTMETRAEAGYVNEKFTTAKVFPNFPENIMSQAQALHLGLEVVPHDEEDPAKQVDLGSGPLEITKGIAVFTWASAFDFWQELSRPTEDLLELGWRQWNESEGRWFTDTEGLGKCSRPRFHAEVSPQ